MVVYVLIFRSLDSKLLDKSVSMEWRQAFPEFNLLLISSCLQFKSAGDIQTYLNYVKFSKNSLALFMLWFFLHSDKTWVYIVQIPSIYF
jgi:hypothetical protein